MGIKDQEIDEVVEEVVETDETLGGDDTELKLGADEVEEEVELDDDGNPVEKAEEIPAWQLEDSDEEMPDVPVKKHIHMKKKFKGRLQERDDEIETLKQKIANLETSTTVTTADLPPKPKAEDFDTDAEHEAALVAWEDKRQDARWAEQQAKTKQEEAKRMFKLAVAKDVDEHYERTAELAESSGIKSEMFKEADTTVRKTVDAILPGRGDSVTDHIISLLGDGSEKVMYYLGRNKAAKLEFQSLLAEDKHGHKAMVFLGQQKERLNNPKKMQSNAPKPPANPKGDLATSQKGAAMKKKYRAAHDKGKAQVAYSLKQQARKEGIDVSTW
jgi:hypothetical protein